MAKKKDELTAEEKQAQQEYYTQEKERIAEENAAYDAAVQNAQDNAATQRASFYDEMMAQRAAAEEQRRQEERQNNIDANAAKYAGVTEFASALTNLVGTSLGATHQQYHQFSQDWMKTADAERRARIARDGQIRERQRAMERQLEAMKKGDAKTLEQMKLQRDKAKAKNQAALNKIGLAEDLLNSTPIQSGASIKTGSTNGVATQTAQAAPANATAGQANGMGGVDYPQGTEKRLIQAAKSYDKSGPGLSKKAVKERVSEIRKGNIEGSKPVPQGIPTFGDKPNPSLKKGNAKPAPTNKKGLPQF